MTGASEIERSMVVLVTGATRGIGRALVEAASAAGHRTVLNYRSPSARTSAQALAKELTETGGETVALQADVTVAADAERLVAMTVERFGGVEAVINNAGVGEHLTLEELDEAAFKRTLQANLTSAFLVSQAAWPRMREHGGRLIFISSGAARSGGGLSAAYAASKAGMEGLMHAYAASLRVHRITANAIAPSMVESAMSAKMEQARQADLPFGRLGRPDEIWPAVRMLLATEYVTGQTIAVNAGRYMT